MWGLQDRINEKSLNHISEYKNDRNIDKDGKIRIKFKPVEEPQGRVHRYRHKRTVSEVDHLNHTENQREANSNQKVDPPHRDACNQRLNQDR